MKYKVSEHQSVDFGDMDYSFFLIGLLNEFMNRFQVVADSFFEEMSWKQCFLLNCIGYCEQVPTLKEISELVGSSHQNVKQMLLKLEKTGFVEFMPDEYDKRKQRIIVTQKAKDFSEKHDKASAEFMEEMFGGVNQENIKITIRTIMQLDEQLKQMK